jgi:hypothetical protein
MDTLPPALEALCRVLDRRNDMTTTYSDRQRTLRAEALRLKAMATQTPTAEWVESLLALVEKERVFAEERTKERYFTTKVMGGRVVEVR